MGANGTPLIDFQVAQMRSTAQLIMQVFATYWSRTSHGLIAKTPVDET